MGTGFREERKEEVSDFTRYADLRLANSEQEALRLIGQRGSFLDGELVTETSYDVVKSDVLIASQVTCTINLPSGEQRRVLRIKNYATGSQTTMTIHAKTGENIQKTEGADPDSSDAAITKGQEVDYIFLGSAWWIL